MLSNLRLLDPDRQSGVLAQTIGLFLDSVPERLAQLRAASAAADLAAVEGHAHRLQGSCGGFGAFRMMALAAEIECRARERRPDGIEALVARLVDEYEPVRQALENERAMPIGP